MKLFPRWTHILRRLLLAVAVLGTGLALAYVEEDVRGHLAWNRFVKERVAAGQPLDFDFYMPARIPDAGNLFKTPILVEFFKYDSAGKAKFDKGTHNVFEFWKNYGRWQKARPTDFRGAYAVLEKAPHPPTSDDRAAAARVLVEFDAIKPQLDEVCEAALTRPRSQMDLKRNGAVAGNAMGTLRVVSHCLCWRASAALAMGNNDEAFRNSYAVLRLIEGPLSVPTPLHLMMGMLLSSMAIQPLWEGCWRDAWSENQLASFQSVLAGMRPLKLLPAAIGMETAVMIPDAKYLPRWMPAGWAQLSAIAHAKYESDSELRTFDPNLGQIDLGEIRRTDDLIDRQGHSLEPVTRLAANMVWRRVPNIALEQGTFVIAETACALERFRIAKGKYPAALADLIPRYMADVPRDPIDGAPLRYTLGADGRFTLYSIGMNGVDDHGAPSTSAKFDYYPWQSSEGDWVWRQPVTR